MQIKENTPRDSRDKYSTQIYKKIYISLVYFSFINFCIIRLSYLASRALAHVVRKCFINVLIFWNARAAKFNYVLPAAYNTIAMFLYLSLTFYNSVHTFTFSLYLLYFIEIYNCIVAGKNHRRSQRLFHLLHLLPRFVKYCTSKSRFRLLISAFVFDDA